MYDFYFEIGSQVELVILRPKSKAMRSHIILARTLSMGWGYRQELPVLARGKQNEESEVTPEDVHAEGQATPVPLALESCHLRI